MKSEVTATDYYNEKARQESIEHRDALLAIASILQTKEGEKLFRFLFKNFEVNNLPERNLKGDDLFECLGFLRAGNSNFINSYAKLMQKKQQAYYLN